MQKLKLIPHPDGACPPFNIECVLVPVRSGVAITFSVEGELNLIRWPSATLPEWTDQLWLTTCFEMFAMGSEANLGYDELNLSPSGEWASFGFLAYRSGQDSLRTVPPDIRTSKTDRHFELRAFGVLPEHGPWRLALSAVIEETDGTKSYWALAHAPGPPDFHNPACFTATLPPPPAP